MQKKNEFKNKPRCYRYAYDITYKSFVFYAQLHEVVMLQTQETKKLSVFDCPGIKTDEIGSGVLEGDLKKTIEGHIMNSYMVIYFFLN